MCQERGLANVAGRMEQMHMVVVVFVVVPDGGEKQQENNTSYVPVAFRFVP